MFFNLLKLFLSNKIRLNIGSGKYGFENSWLNTDVNSLNILNTNDWKKNLYFFKADVIFSEHVWEHLTESEAEIALKNCFNYLKKGGTLRIAVPDGLFPDDEYINHVKPMGVGPGADDHKILYTYKSLKVKMENAGFAIALIEYWDEQGNFVKNKMDDKLGFVKRSSEHDKRNVNGVLKYTSLIIDGIKK